MRRSWMILAALCLLGLPAGGAGASEGAAAGAALPAAVDNGAAPAKDGGLLATRGARDNYACGVETARGLRAGGVVFEEAPFLRGLKDGLAGEGILLSEEELLAVRTELQKEQIRRMKVAKLSREQKSKRTAEANRRAGEAFLAENGRKEGVVTLPSGLQYRILKAGTGRRPAEGDTVEVRYRGTLVDGTEYDRSARSGKPSLLKVSRLVPGFREALTLMPEGSTWQLVLPPALAYGESGTGRVGPATTIVLEVELIAVK